MSEVTMEKESVFESRWGFHPCSYETFVKLKKLHKAFWQSEYKLAAWKRWSAKLPHNRIKFRWIRNEQGQKVGKEILGMREEPKCSELFVKTDKWGRKFVSSHGIIDAYNQARMPKPKEEVKPLSICESMIDHLYSQLSE